MSILFNVGLSKLENEYIGNVIKMLENTMWLKAFDNIKDNVNDEVVKQSIVLIYDANIKKKDLFHYFIDYLNKDNEYRFVIKTITKYVTVIQVIKIDNEEEVMNFMFISAKANSYKTIIFTTNIVLNVKLINNSYRIDIIKNRYGSSGIEVFKIDRQDIIDI